MTFVVGRLTKAPSIAHDGQFPARSTQQGYSPFSTWTRGWLGPCLGYAEELEFFESLEPAEFERGGWFQQADM